MDCAGHGSVSTVLAYAFISLAFFCLVHRHDFSKLAGRFLDRESFDYLEVK